MADPLDSPALDGSPAQAYASHRARANGIARHLALANPLAKVHGDADEDKALYLLAHCHAVDHDLNFQVPGEPPSAEEIPAALGRLSPGHGQVGTLRDYDLALKGLVTLAYRYRHRIGQGGFDHLLERLVPAYLRGGHPPDLEVIQLGPIRIPETENHLLMIESSRYLVNQLVHDQSPHDDLRNDRNGLTDWLVGYLQRFLQHEFLEFNARPYQRLALHPIYNLYDFAREEAMRTAARLVLDYSMTKVAVSSVRGRRVTPFRRVQHRINHPANERNDLLAHGGDQGNWFFLAATGMTGPDGSPARFPPPEFCSFVAGTSSYRPPPAAYHVALDPVGPALHWFHHGTRPRLPGSPDIADAGVELYHRSPSFLLSAGGVFLNSGYGHDEVDVFVNAWTQTSRAQATTLIPQRIDTRFHDLVRFEPYPDPRVDPYADDREDPDTLHARAVSTGVHRGIMMGANLRPAPKRTLLEEATSTYPTLAAHAGRMFMAWKGSGNDRLNLAQALDTQLLGIDGVEGVEGKAIFSDATDAAPAIASHAGRLVVAWKGAGNDQLNLAVVSLEGRQLQGKAVLGDSSEHSPALASHGGHLYLAWTGNGNEHLNVARVVLHQNTAGVAGIEAVVDKVTLADTSEAAPALASHAGRLFLAWKGSGNDDLNLLSSTDGASFGAKATFPESSSHGPALASHAGRLFLAWKGSGNEHLNVAKVSFSTAVAFGVEGMEDKVVLDEISSQPPSIGSHAGLLFLAWKGEGEDHLNLRVSRDGRFQPTWGWGFCDLERLGFHLAVYRAPVTRPEDLDTPIDDLGIVYAAEVDDLEELGMSFDDFRTLMESQNDLPAAFDYDSVVRFRGLRDDTFDLWFAFVGQRHTARVTELAEGLGDLAALPLVSGPYLAAPGGHDGLVEIRDPHAPAPPLVLDLRDAAHPTRTDDVGAHPQPWIARAEALFTIAASFRQQGRVVDAGDARAHAVALWDQLLRRSPEHLGAPLAGPAIAALADLGVDHSVPDADLRAWLANPIYTPYPAMAQAILLLGARLRRPVYLDVIVHNYEHTPAVTSPRTADDVSDLLLRQAIVDGFEIRHGTQVAGFDDVIEP